MQIDPRLLAGSVLALVYNDCVGRLPSRALRKFYLRLWLGALGPHTGVMMGARFLNGRKIFIGERNVINRACVLDGRRYCICTGRNVSIGPESVILTLGHDPQAAEVDCKGGDVEIGDYAWLGYRVLVLPGVTIGEGAVVGAGSVVAKSVAPYTIVVGNPARKIGERQKALKYQLDYDPFLE